VLDPGLLFFAHPHFVHLSEKDFGTAVDVFHGFVSFGGSTQSVAARESSSDSHRTQIASEIAASSSPIGTATDTVQ
jgi:hypothetical protein